MKLSKSTQESPPLGAQPASPCVRNCCLDDHDVCLGCFRTLQDILNWSEATDEQRLAVLEQAEQRKRANPFYSNS